MSLSLRFLFHVKTKTEEFPLKHIHSICKSVPKLLFQNLKFQTFKIASDYKYQYRYMYLEYRAVSLEWIYMAILLNLFLPLINYMLMTFFNVAIFRVHLGNFFNEWQSKLETFLDYSVSLCESSVIYCEYIWFRTQRHLLVRLFNQNLLQTRKEAEFIWNNTNSSLWYLQSTLLILVYCKSKMNGSSNWSSFTLNNL